MTDAADPIEVVGALAIAREIDLVIEATIVSVLTDQAGNVLAIVVAAVASVLTIIIVRIVQGQTVHVRTVQDQTVQDQTAHGQIDQGGTKQVINAAMRAIALQPSLVAPIRLAVLARINNALMRLAMQGGTQIVGVVAAGQLTAVLRGALLEDQIADQTVISVLAIHGQDIAAIAESVLRTAIARGAAMDISA